MGSEMCIRDRFLPPPQLAYQRPIALRIENHRLPARRHPVVVFIPRRTAVSVRPAARGAVIRCARGCKTHIDVEVLGIDFNHLVAAAIRGVEAQDDAAFVAELVAVAVARVLQFPDVLGAQRDQA